VTDTAGGLPYRFRRPAPLTSRLQKWRILQKVEG
jgi:hypothetical protein